MALIKGFHPDSPLAKGGVLISGRRRQTDSSSTPSENSVDPKPDLMQPAIDQIEMALRSKAERISNLTPEQYARYKAGEPLNSVLSLPGSTTTESIDNN